MPFSGTVIGISVSQMQPNKAVPQGSISGPLIFNIFINDIFYFLKKCSMHNYADDNTVSNAHKQVTVLKAVYSRK